MRGLLLLRAYLRPQQKKQNQTNRGGTRKLQMDMDTPLSRYPSYNNNNNNKRPLTPKSMPPAGDEHAKLKT